METKKFQRTKEAFICEHCGKRMEGSGYTNHCPYCLYSKHVDIHPGDRKEACGGIMKPIAALYKKMVMSCNMNVYNAGKRKR